MDTVGCVDGRRRSKEDGKNLTPSVPAVGSGIVNTWNDPTFSHMASHACNPSAQEGMAPVRMWECLTY